MFDIFFSNLPYLMKGAVQTIWLGLAGVALGTLIGLILGILNAAIGGFTAGLINIYFYIKIIESLSKPIKISIQKTYKTALLHKSP